MLLMYSTGINIVTLKLSNKNSHFTDNNSESIQLINNTDTSDSERITSKKAIEDKTEDNNKHKVVKIWDPVTPIFLPNSPDIIEPIRGNIKIVKYIMF